MPNLILDCRLNWNLLLAMFKSQILGKREFPIKEIKLLLYIKTRMDFHTYSPDVSKRFLVWIPQKAGFNNQPAFSTTKDSEYDHSGGKPRFTINGKISKMAPKLFLAHQCQ